MLSMRATQYTVDHLGTRMVTVVHCWRNWPSCTKYGHGYKMLSMRATKDKLDLLLLSMVKIRNSLYETPKITKLTTLCQGWSWRFTALYESYQTYSWPPCTKDGHRRTMLSTRATQHKVDLLKLRMASVSQCSLWELHSIQLVKTQPLYTSYRGRVATLVQWS